MRQPRVTPIPLDPRVCDCCGEQSLESLWNYDHEAVTISDRWLFRVRNVICPECGFVFTPPVLNGAELLRYYGDSFTRFEGQSLDYDIEKRLCVIEQFIAGRELFVEVGSNLMSSFQDQLTALFEQVLTHEPNQSADSSCDGIDSIADDSVDGIAHYFVLEHVPDIAGFLREMNRVLRSGGIMICEVPLLSLYEDYISPLILHEHVNHFTQDTLACIAAKQGFELLHSSQEKCSRPFGFVSVFRKSSTVQVSVPQEYERNKAQFNNGKRQADLYFQRMHSARELVTQSDDPIIIWAANETSNRLLEGVIPRENVCVIDSSSGKKDFFSGRCAVLQPNAARKQIAKAEYIILCTQRHAPTILQNLETEYGKSFEESRIRIIDRL